MTVWIDANLSPALARWITESFVDIEAFSAVYLGLLDADDVQIRAAAQHAGAVILTKDRDFADAAQRDAAQPPVLWVRAGSTSTPAMKRILSARLPAALGALSRGARIVELHEVEA